MPTMRCNSAIGRLIISFHLAYFYFPSCRSQELEASACSVIACDSCHKNYTICERCLPGFDLADNFCANDEGPVKFVVQMEDLERVAVVMDDVASTAGPDVAYFDRIEPEFGPVAGGTLVNLTGHWPGDVTSYFINFADNNQSLSETITSFNASLMSFMTSSVADVGAWTVGVKWDGGNVSGSPKTFEYRGNPSISGLKPENQSIAGGTRLTVVGSNLNSVAFPVISVSVIIESSNHTFSAPSVARQLCIVNASDSHEMICPMPELKSLTDFQNNASNVSTGQSSTARKRREFAEQKMSEVSSRRRREAVLYRSDGSAAHIVISFEFDGFPGYRNSTNVTNTINFVKPITIRPNAGPPLAFNPLMDDNLLIDGSSLTSVGSRDDFAVTIGVGDCVIIDITSNSLTCIPPRKVPQKDTSNTCQKDSLDVMVYFANTPFFYSCIYYNKPITGGLDVAGLAGGVTSAVIVLFVAVVVVILIRQIRHSRRPSLQFEDHIHEHDELYNRSMLRNPLRRGNANSRPLTLMPPNTGNVSIPNLGNEQPWDSSMRSVTISEIRSGRYLDNEEEYRSDRSRVDTYLGTVHMIDRKKYDLRRITLMPPNSRNARDSREPAEFENIAISNDYARDFEEFTNSERSRRDYSRNFEAFTLTSEDPSVIASVQSGPSP